MPNEKLPDKITINEVVSLMGVPRSTARQRLDTAGIRKYLGRHPTSKRPVVLYPRADVEKLIAEGFRPPGRPKAGEARR
jgi:hypothetical protein